jgi:hypothetical protein
MYGATSAKPTIYENSYLLGTEDACLILFGRAKSSFCTARLCFLAVSASGGVTRRGPVKSQYDDDYCPQNDQQQLNGSLLAACSLVPILTLFQD